MTRHGLPRDQRREALERSRHLVDALRKAGLDVPAG
jgi:hypothetical protein